MKVISSKRERLNDDGTRDSGFTLVEIVIAIVLVGVLAAVVVVGISNLTEEGSDSACDASLDAARAGAIVYYAQNDNTYPVDFTELTTEGTDGAPPALTLSDGVAVDKDDPTKVSGGDWILTMTANENGAPTFVCS